ncbi:MAG: HAD family phosphatase [Prevotella sp.]|nr:HAD family phosphatase [Prevotella sp.]
MKNEQLKAALFDLDGVVFDTEPQYSVFWGEQCRHYHPEHPGLEHEIKGSTLVQIYDRWWTGELEQERDVVTRRLNEFEAQMTYDYISGLETFIADLHRHDVKTAVVTSSNVPKMESVYRAHPEFHTLFDAILTSEDFAESKPSPDCYLRAARRFGLSNADCVVFEDSINGLRSGLAADMMVVGLLTTNSLEAVEPLSNYQLKNYNNINFKRLNQLWQDI